ncbi:MAG TPA: ABC transporter substrate-binding protein [Casimicrobiaceae bacterium]|nr:ABC transporter substrate-binding protein [Casimicrobiaceae bacterium]
MWLRSFGCVATALALSVSAPVLAQSKAYRIGWLGDGTPPPAAAQSSSDFQQGLRDIGYVGGRSIPVEYRYAGGDVDKLSALAGELVQLPVDVIVTSGEPAALAATRATKTIPIVVTQIGVDPVKAGLVASLARPGGNVTGLATLNEELWSKRLGLLKEVAPNVSKLAVLWNPANPGNSSCIEEIKSAAQALQLQIASVEVRDTKALDRVLTSIANDTNALAACWDSVLLERAGAIAEFALKRRLPTLAPLKEYVEEGFLLSLGASLSAHKRRTAYYVDKILKGAKPADLPVERATLFELVVNVKTAKALGLTLPPTLLVLADDVIR